MIAAADLSEATLDDFLALALRDPANPFPTRMNGVGAKLLARITYHGIAGLLAARAALATWPGDLAQSVRTIAKAQAMWELRHAAVLRGLLAKFAESGVDARLLKGTALAYDLYDHPSERARGDTDLLIGEPDLGPARDILAKVGFDSPDESGFLPPSLRSQESWYLTAPDGSRHCIDLHWRPMNAPALDRAFGPTDWFVPSRDLPALSNAARAPSRATLLLHACVHRSMHDFSPYQVGEDTHFGGDRLIWLWDIALIGRSLGGTDWAEFKDRAKRGGVASACVTGLEHAANRFGPIAPDAILQGLRDAPASPYLAGGQVKRALLDVIATPGLRPKARYVWARLLPDRHFIRAKYPEMSNSSLPRLYGRRFIDLLRRRG